MRGSWEEKMIAGKAIRRMVTAALMAGAGHAAIAQEMTQE